MGTRQAQHTERIRLRSPVWAGARRLWSYSAGIIVVLALWEIGARQLQSLFVPPVSVIAVTFVDRWLSADPGSLFLSELFWTHGALSIRRASAGWLIGGALGIAAGLLMGASRPVQDFFAPVTRFGLAMPPTAMLPIAVIVFGLTSTMTVFLVAFGTVWPVLFNTIDGVNAIDDTVRRTAQSLHLNRRTTLTRVILPAASPPIVAGLRVAVGIALILVVIAELFASRAGIGYYIVFNQRTFQYDDMWSALALLAVVGVLANGLFALAEARVLRWQGMVGGDVRS